MSQKVTFVMCLMLLSVIGCRADGWTMEEGLALNDGTPVTNSIRSLAAGRCGPHKTFSSSCYMRYADCSGSDLNCAMALDIMCTQPAHYRLSVVWECQSCGKNLSARLMINVRLNTDRGFQSPDSRELQFQLLGSSDKDGVVEAPLTAEQVRALSQSHSIMIAAIGRPVIYTEPRQTAAAFAWLAAACELSKP